MYEIFWMVVGATIGAIITHLYKNKNFQAAIREEREAIRESLRNKI